MRQYTPRRFGARWSEGAPSYVLDVFDNPDTCDRYTVLIAGPFLEPTGRTYANTRLALLGLTAGASWYSDEMPAFQAAPYRYRNGKARIRWSDLPKCVREQVRWWVETCFECDQHESKCECEKGDAQASAQ